jgi:hypothetical protein
MPAKIGRGLGDRLKPELQTVTALPAKIGRRLGAAVQRRRRDLYVVSRESEIQSPGGAAYSEHQHKVLLINVYALCKRHFPERAASDS